MQLTQIEEHQGLSLSSTIEIPANIIVVVGKNGAGKTRLIQAIAEEKFTIVRNNKKIGKSETKHFPNGLRPSIFFQFDPASLRTTRSEVKKLYLAYKGKLVDDTYLGIQNSFFVPADVTGLDLQSFVRAIRVASRTTKQGINELDENDVAEFYSFAATDQMGALNLSAIIREYLEHKELNDRNEYRNHKYGLTLPVRNPEEFERIFGPAPWVLFNDLMKSAFAGKYQVDTPKTENPDDYVPIIRRHDGKQIDPTHFSTGEKILLWLCLSMYSTTSGLITYKPSLLLLDEPDASLHPAMIQQLYIAIDLLVQKFDCTVLLTSHSPTTVALAPTNTVWQITENALIEIEKDRAIADLLHGVDQVSIHYTNRRQVYVESHNDASIYNKIYTFLKRKKAVAADHISLSFLPASSKLPPTNIQQIHESVFGIIDPDKLKLFIDKINGQGNSVQVIGTVESLEREDNPTVHGIIDWDTTNKSTSRIHVHAPEIFYSIENSILNPLTLSIYLLTIFPNRFNVSHLGFKEHKAVDELISDPSTWQLIVDRFTKLVLQDQEITDTVVCTFGDGTDLLLAKAYVHHNGHDLEILVKQKFPYLKELRNRLLDDVVDKTITLSGVKTIPRTFVQIFNQILGQM